MGMICDNLKLFFIIVYNKCFVNYNIYKLNNAIRFAKRNCISFFERIPRFMFPGQVSIRSLHLTFQRETEMFGRENDTVHGSQSVDSFRIDKR